MERSIAEFELEHAAENSGLTAIGFGLALRRLKQRRFVRNFEETIHDESYSAITLTEQGWSWLGDHESLFVLHKKASPQENFDDNIPF